MRGLGESHLLLLNHLYPLTCLISHPLLHSKVLMPLSFVSLKSNMSNFPLLKVYTTYIFLHLSFNPYTFHSTIQTCISLIMVQGMPFSSKPMCIFCGEYSPSWGSQPQPHRLGKGAGIPNSLRKTCYPATLHIFLTQL